MEVDLKGSSQISVPNYKTDASAELIHKDEDEDKSAHIAISAADWLNRRLSPPPTGYQFGGIIELSMQDAVVIQSVSNLTFMISNSLPHLVVSFLADGFRVYRAASCGGLSCL